MPVLDFLGKPIVYAHHMGVPYRALEPVAAKSVLPKAPKGKGGKNGAVLEEANLVIQGDNLHALKALMPRYAGRVDCVCIDPPYNTGNEGWVYNDNVNFPLMRRWMDENGVDRDDMERHDKWLCMMWPRLHLLQELLADDGVIFVFIDDNEQHHLRMLMDQIFGEENFIANIVVRTNPGGRDYGGVARTHDYVVVYGNSEKSALGMVSVDEGALPMSDGAGGFELRELRNRNARFNADNRPNLHYPFYANPRNADENGLHEVSLEPKKGWTEVWPLESGGVKTVWRWGKDKARGQLNEDVKAKPKRDNGGFQIVEKFRRNGTRVRSIMDDTDYRNERGTLTLRSLLGGRGGFDYPKSDALVKRLLEVGTRRDSIVLDSFAGSGTTAHAVLALNAEDDGDRRFLLVECEDYADKITAERIRRVIRGVPKARDEKLRKGLGGKFVFCKLGDSVDEETIFNGDLPAYDTLARYVAHTATGTTLEKIQRGKDGFFGEAGGFRLHMLYKPDEEFLMSPKSALTRDVAERVGAAARARGKRALFFAVEKFMSQNALTPLGVVFCRMPGAMTRRFLKGDYYAR